MRDCGDSGIVVMRDCRGTVGDWDEGTGMRGLVMRGLG